MIAIRSWVAAMFGCAVLAGLAQPAEAKKAWFSNISVPTVGKPDQPTTFHFDDYSKIVDDTGRRVLDDRYDPVDFLLVSDRLMIARETRTQKVVFVDPKTHKVTPTDYSAFGRPKFDEEGKFVWAVRAPIDRQNSGPLPDKAWSASLLGLSGEVLAVLPQIGGDAFAMRETRAAAQMSIDGPKAFMRARGNTLLVLFEGPDGSARSQLYGVNGHPASPQLPAMLIATYYAGAVNQLPDAGEMALQGATLEPSQSLGFGMTFYPVAKEGGLVQLPPGAIGMIPMFEAMGGGPAQQFHPEIAGGERIFNPVEHHGWAIVYAEKDAISYGVSHSSAEFAAANADSLPRYTALSYTTSSDADYPFQAKRADGTWVLLNPFNLKEYAGNKDQSRLVSDYLAATRAADQARRDAEARAAAASAAAAAERKRRADQAVADARLDVERRQIFYANATQAAMDHNDALGAMRNAREADCATFRRAYMKFGMQSVFDVEAANKCGMSGADIESYGGPGYRKWRKDADQVAYWNNFSRAVSQWAATPSQSSVIVRTYGADGSTHDTVMTREQYDDYKRD